MIEHPQGGRMFIAPQGSHWKAHGTALPNHVEFDTATLMEDLYSAGSTGGTIYTGAETSTTVLMPGSFRRRLFMTTLVDSTVSLESDDVGRQAAPLRVATEISGAHRRLAMEALSYPHFSVVEVRLPREPEA